jgi:hypothetical protein
VEQAYIHLYLLTLRFEPKSVDNKASSQTNILHKHYDIFRLEVRSYLTIGGYVVEQKIFSLYLNMQR